MNKQTTIGVYGTLRKGFYNHERCRMNECEYLGTDIISGYKMFFNGYFPAIIKTDNEKDIIFIEIYNVPDEIFNPIKRMEENAGYHINKVGAISLFVMDDPQVDGWSQINDGVFN